MKHTLNIDDELLAQAQEASGAKTKTEAVEEGLRALVRRAAYRRLAALGGTMPDAWAAPRRRPPHFTNDAKPPKPRRSRATR